MSLRFNPTFILLAASGLFFTLSAFFWMVVKSYHVMSRTRLVITSYLHCYVNLIFYGMIKGAQIFFRGQIVSSDKVGVRFAMYCAFGFGGSLASTLITLIFDNGVSLTSTPNLFKYRPGK